MEDASSHPGSGTGATESEQQVALLRLVDESSMSIRRVVLWWLAAAGTLLNGMSLLLLGVGLPLAGHEFGFDATVVGLVGAALVFGSVPGSLVGGRVADKVGRKPLLVADLAVVAAGALVSAYADGAALLVLGQFVIGFGIGMDFPVGSSYIAETTPKAVRARLVVAGMALQAIGMVLGAVVGLAMVSTLDSISAWRWLMALLAAAAAAIGVARLIAPESPRWLMLAGRNDAAARAVGWLVPTSKEEAHRLAAAVGDVRHVVSEGQERAGIRTLFTSRWRRRTLLVLHSQIFVPLIESAR